MKQLLLILLLCGFVHMLSAQSRNVNPDPNGEPWIVSNLRMPTDKELAKYPKVNLSDNYRKSKSLPASLDNSTQAFFRPVFNQDHGSCGQASGIAYNFTYEMNLLNGTNANTTTNQYPSHYTYNFLNDGSGENGSWYFEGWEIIRYGGCPNVDSYGGLTADDKYWMSGYDKYLAGMPNKVAEILSFDVSNPEGLETLKYWMYDHLDGSDVGGIANFAAGVTGEFMLDENGIISEWGSAVNHAMTFVGWDDNIKFDYNNDGKYTNNEDINGDGTVDMKDWEVGALIMVNSWGTGFGIEGKAYVMYKLLAETHENGGILMNSVQSIKTRNSDAPQLLMKVKMSHNLRNQIKISAGISSDLNAESPDSEISFPIFNKQGGAYNMQGYSDLPIEVTFDITQLLSYVNSGSEAKFFFIVDEDDVYSSGVGEIQYFSIVNTEDEEIVCENTNVVIENDQRTILSLNTSVVFDAPEIITESLPMSYSGQDYSCQLEAQGGAEPYTWSLLLNYTEENDDVGFPYISSQKLETTNDDDGYAVQNLEFSFPFFGKKYNKLVISTDGSVLFKEGFEFLRTEQAIINTEMIGVFASDLMIYPDQGDGIYYEGDANSATFRWKTSLYDQPEANVDVAVTLYPDGKIKMFYGNDITSDLSWASGISKGDGKNYLISELSGNIDIPATARQYNSNPFPSGLEITSEGFLHGALVLENNTWDIEVVVTDINQISKTKTLAFSTVYTGVEIERIVESEISVYPNPFKHQVNISFELEESKIVKVDIYNSIGQKVSEISNQLYSPGKHNIIWNKNEASKQVQSSGIYICRFTIDGKVYVKSLICNE